MTEPDTAPIAADTPTGAEANPSLPDRLAASANSPFHDADLLERGVGILFNGVEKTNVDEYCVSEGWIRVTAGKTKDRAGNAMTIKLKGVVQPFLRTGG